MTKRLCMTVVGSIFYSSMAIDPDGCTFWYVEEYYVTPASDAWQTTLISFRFNDCH